MILEPGTIFARDFRVEKPLAEGGMGAVYVVQQLSTGRRRALKLMQPELVQNDDLRRRFILEAKVGASIASEHVVEVQLAGVDEQSGAPFLVMELLEGEDLQARIEREGRLSSDDVRALFRQICHALRLAHKAGVVHRDLKPANVFLAAPKREGQGRFHVKVLDFGIAKMTNDATVSASKTGMIGTPLWMAPEQADHAPVTPAADVWALGLILYTCITGRSFWRNGNTEDSSLQQIFREILFDPIPRAVDRAREQGTSFPGLLDPVIAGSLVRRPTERLPDAGAFLSALEDAFEGRLVDDQLPSLEPAVEPRHRPSATAPAPDRVAMPLGKPLLAQGRPVPWYFVYLAPIAFVAVLGLIVWKMKHDPGPPVLTRLGTVGQPVANGPYLIQDLRHDVEEQFPKLDELCVKKATSSGQAILRWTIRDGTASNESVESLDRITGNCLLHAVARRAYPIVVAGSFAPTDVTYILEWNPALKPL